MTETEVAVIGGGASGLMASIASALAGADTIILEHMDRVGKKILATCLLYTSPSPRDA